MIDFTDLKTEDNKRTQTPSNIDFFNDIISYNVRQKY